MRHVSCSAAETEKHGAVLRTTRLLPQYLEEEEWMLVASCVSVLNESSLIFIRCHLLFIQGKGHHWKRCLFRGGACSAGTDAAVLQLPAVSTSRD